MRNQVAMPSELKEQLWHQIIRRKIENQARGLTLLGRDGAEKVMRYTAESNINRKTVDALEANAAREYFYYLHPGLNRRNEEPVNSCLNYGYAVLRNAIIRSVILAGFQPAIGLHHDSYLNAFNLADDLVEPWRAMVDLIALQDPGTSVVLSRKKRRELATVLHHACLLDGTRMTVLAGIEEMVGSLRRIVISDENETLKLPIILPIEIIEAVRE